MMKKQKITYAKVGDNYHTKDPIKKLAQVAAAKTAVNLKKSGFSEISDSRGESAFVWSQGNILMAAVVEGLGTKNLVADAMYQATGRTYYDVIGHDTVACIINDLITVGTKPLVIHAYWAIEDNSWLSEKKRMTDFITGWKKACDFSDATWGGGETPTLKGVICKNTVDLGGSAIGIISPSNRLITDNKLVAGDRILFLKSNGINCNGISLARAVAKKLPKGYATKFADSKLYGEALLEKTNIYAKLIRDLLDAGVDIHYISNITGHGLRKIMRARGNLTYVIEKIFEPQEVFLFIQKHANLSDDEIYQTLNMGQDYVIFLPAKDVEKAQNIIKKNGFQSINAGYVEAGPRQAKILPKNLTFKSETLD